MYIILAVKAIGLSMNAVLIPAQTYTYTINII